MTYGRPVNFRPWNFLRATWIKRERTNHSVVNRILVRNDLERESFVPQLRKRSQADGCLDRGSEHRGFRLELKGSIHSQQFPGLSHHLHFQFPLTIARGVDGGV